MTLSRHRPAVVLASASSGGTLAAVRQLSSSGIRVRVISSEWLAAAAWSSRADRSYRAPRECQTDQFLDRLMEIGADDPGQVLLATSDVTAWLYTSHANTLERYFRLYQPSLETIKGVLDKARLADLAMRAGLTVLPSVAPTGLYDVIALSPRLSYPLLIKPRSHVNRLRNDKGIVVRNPTDLIEKYRETLEREGIAEAKNAVDASLLPILQHFVEVGTEGVHSITGFIDRTGELFVTRHSTKVFLRSRPVGVGLCYESLDPNPELSDAVHRMCRDIGYFGVFEAEFVKYDDTWAIIDFNPRFFNQVGLDIGRGMPLPLLAWLDASGDYETLRTEVAKAQACEATLGKAVFYDQFTFNVMLAARRASGRISRQDYKMWRGWIIQHKARAVDVAVDAHDRIPGMVHAASELCQGLLAIPRFVSLIRPHAPPRLANMVKAPQ